MKLEHRLRLRYSKKYRKDFYIHYNKYKEDGDIISERDFMIQYDTEGLQKAYTKWFILSYILIPLFTLAIPLSYAISIKYCIANCLLVILSILLNKKFKNDYLLSKSFVDFSRSIYADLIAKKYRF